MTKLILCALLYNTMSIQEVDSVKFVESMVQDIDYDEGWISDEEGWISASDDYDDDASSVITEADDHEDLMHGESSL